jgi:hypothetical protein
MELESLTGEPWEELARREGDGIAVSLMWDRRRDTLTVVVGDAAWGESFALHVEAAEALEVFEHPYAYAAFRGVDYHGAAPADEPEPAYA